MAHDPNEQFDHAVLDMIEHSPVGSVPSTPAYQDALKRLYRTHQVYASAEHKDGHVTARSLSGRPAFHAENLWGLEAGSVAPEALEPNASVFGRYLASLSQTQRAAAEVHRIKVAGRPVHHRAKHLGSDKLPVPHDLLHTVFLVSGSGPHPGLPGSYLYGSVVEAAAGSAHGPWSVHLHDRDDGGAVFDAPTLGEALGKLHEVLDCAPFSMDELEALGFHLT